MVFVYTILVFGDYIIAQRILYIEHQSNQESKSWRIQQQRKEEEDVPQIKIAVKNGFKPLIFPSAVEQLEALRALYLRLGVAPLAPQPNSSSYLCNEGYGLITYTTDRFGFRNANDLWDSNVDLVLIGDSFAHGHCVIDRDTIAGNLLSRSKVLNLGTGDNNPIHYAALAKVFLPYLKPRKAIIIFSANDNDVGDTSSIFYDAYFNKQATYFELSGRGEISLNKPLRDFYAESEHVIEDARKSGVNTENQFLKGRNFFQSAYKYLLLSNIRTQLNTHIFASDLPFSSRLAIDTLIEVCKSDACEPIVYYIPNSDFWVLDPRSKSYARKLFQYTQMHKVRFVDTTELLSSIGEEAYAVKGGHLSPKGYNRVAASIAEVINSGCRGRHTSCPKAHSIQ